MIAALRGCGVSVQIGVRAARRTESGLQAHPLIVPYLCFPSGFCAKGQRDRYSLDLTDVSSFDFEEFAHHHA
jgi:hypothetical protein